MLWGPHADDQPRRGAEDFVQCSCAADNRVLVLLLVWTWAAEEAEVKPVALLKKTLENMLMRRRRGGGGLPMLLLMLSEGSGSGS